MLTLVGTSIETTLDVILVFTHAFYAKLRNNSISDW